MENIKCLFDDSLVDNPTNSTYKKSHICQAVDEILTNKETEPIVSLFQSTRRKGELGDT